MSNIYLGSTPYIMQDSTVSGEFVVIEGEKYYKITHVNQMPDFFMTIISDSNHWLFLSSNGSLSAGRKDKDNALFPYYTDDKIHDYCGITGSKTIVLVEQDDKTMLWEPFSKELAFLYNIERNLYKSEYGNKIVFEEINNDLELTFQYVWCSSEQYGFVKKSSISNQSASTTSINILDGISNILPNGATFSLQTEYSNLLDGYKKNELLENTTLGLYMLSSIPVDTAEPSESLNATTVWSIGLEDQKTLLSNNQLQNFKYGQEIHTETDVKATRGSYYVNSELQLQPEQQKQWYIVAEVNQNNRRVANLNQFLTNTAQIPSLVEEDINKGTINLVKMVAAADGLQQSNEELSTARHFSNTLFNIMRGGTYLDGYNIQSSDFKHFVNQINSSIAKKFEAFLNDLPSVITYQELMAQVLETQSDHLIRICHEYLPLTFSRRHGDPSRPWNEFSIDNKNEDGSTKSDYQGNWRDIFQNWEALCLSYPEYIKSIISKFLNASTADGYNPYRIMRDGIDWECPDEADPWANIGYWGDHQIIYLQKLLELSEEYHPGEIDSLLTKDIFAYANVPYRINSYEDIVKNPKDTLVFDHKLNNQINKLVKKIGADGRLIMHSDNTVYHVNLTEKILVSVLAKLTNFVPEAGIWLTTQRPEWNDANNALVGNGASVVTLCYLRRFLSFWNKKFQASTIKSISISSEVKTLLDQIFTLFTDNHSILGSGFDDHQRRYFADTLGQAGADYRNSIYENSFSRKQTEITVDELANFTGIALDYINQSIFSNRRHDGLYDSYNLLSFKNESVSIRRLYEMLEGQVAVLSSGCLTTIESHDLLESLKSSKLYVPKQYSYMLYPDRELPRFFEKNNIPLARVESSKLLSQLITNNDTSIINVDDSGNHHFNGQLRNSDFLENALNELDKESYGALIETGKSECLDTYEEMFDHQSYTGRSGTFYAYEGLGSIYWHMVSKLLLAVQECFFKAVADGEAYEVCGRIKDHYYEIKAGIGIYKPPELYGAFPIDAYSHTPGNTGAKQPGMTGQVKEDVISRMACLGVRVIQGQITINTTLLSHNEFLKEDTSFEFYSVDGLKQQLQLKPRQLAFTICQVPVVYSHTDHEKIIIHFANGKTKEILGLSIDSHISSLIFNRENQVSNIEVSIK